MEPNLDRIKAFTFDVDGVMTDGSLVGLSDGDLVRIYNAKDTFCIRMAIMNGYHVGVITGGESEGIRKRFLSCGVLPEDLYMRSHVKIRDFENFCRKYGLKPEEVCYVGDDLPDVPVIKASGLGVAPSDAVTEVKEAADYISPNPGGKGCIREIMEKVMRHQGKWKFEENHYENFFNARVKR